MKRFLIALSAFLLANSAFAIANDELKIFSFQKNEYISLSELSEMTSNVHHLILGEYHYNEKIQDTQAKIIKEVVTAKNANGLFTVGWEFLLHENQSEIHSTFTKFKSGLLTGIELMNAFFPNAGENSKNHFYLPILEETAKLGGELIGLNASREVKRYITRGSLTSLPEIHQVPNMELGGENYLSRFKDAMGGHVGGDTLMRYYEAQCYTDSVMAYKFNNIAQNDLRFTIVGSFHSDFSDGYVTQLSRYSEIPSITIKIVDKNELTEEQLSKLTKVHPKYGAIADFVIIAK